MRHPRRLAALAASAALGVGLIGLGTYAQYSDTANATDNVNVGQFEISVSSDTPGAQVVNNTSGATHAHTVSLTVGNINSRAGTAPLNFKVTSLGDVPAKIHVEQAVTQTAATTFSSLLPVPVADVTLNQGQSQSYAGGLSWPELNNNDRGKSATVTYSITVSEDSASYVPPLGTFQRDSANQITVRLDHWGSTQFRQGDTLSTYNNAVVAGVSGWNDNLATADANGVIYYRGNGIGTCKDNPGTPPFYFDKVVCTGVAPVGHLQVTIKRGGSQLVNPGVL